ncbi:MAG TPA: DUF6178 family protein [Vicinamibacterales bacterium]|nr:DUF6178 family protein [Vicinamibacterales bacterium]
MAAQRTDLARLLHARHLELIVPRLPSPVLHRLVQQLGLESAGTVLALATPAQLARVIDDDVWRARAGAGEELDVERFGVWLCALVDTGTTVAADALAQLDPDLTAAAFGRHIAVFDHAAVSAYLSIDGDLRGGRESSAPRAADIGGYRVEAKALPAWDAILELLTFLHDDRQEAFQRLMRSCVRLSNSDAEEDGFHALLQDNAQQLADVMETRQERREREGYVSAAQARAFLAGARRLDVQGQRPPRSVVAGAYFRELTSAASDTASTSGSDVPSAPSEPDDIPAIELAVADFVEALAEAGVLDTQPRALLGTGNEQPPALLTAHVASHGLAAEELAYLANVLLAGCTVRRRAFSPAEASAAAAATCNLGLEHWPAAWRDRDLVTAFQVGWQVLQREVSLNAARHLHAALGTFACRDRILQLRLAHLRVRLGHAIADGAPWRVGEALDAILPLNPAVWTGLAGLIDECPVLHAAVRDPRTARGIAADDFRFFSSKADIAVAREFIRTLPALLAPR